MDWVTALFLVGGVLLIASEAVHMALIPVFLGVAALVVAALRGMGVLESVPLSFLVWSVTSLALTLPLRPLLKKLIGRGEVKFDRSDEVRDAMGEIVEVVDDIDDVTSNGRVRFQGTTWSARAVDGKIAKGTRARLYAKDKAVWVVEALSALDDNNRVPAFDAGAQVDAQIAELEVAEAAKGKK